MDALKRKFSPIYVPSLRQILYPQIRKLRALVLEAATSSQRRLILLGRLGRFWAADAE